MFNDCKFFIAALYKHNRLFLDILAVRDPEWVGEEHQRDSPAGDHAQEPGARPRGDWGPYACQLWVYLSQVYNLSAIFFHRGLW